MSYEESIGSNLTQEERLLFDIEDSLSQTYLSELDPTSSVDLMSERGKQGVTSIYAECFSAIDSLPKVLDPKRIGKTGLSKQGIDLLEAVDHAIELDPLFNYSAYTRAKEYLDYWKYKTPPPGYLTDPAQASSFPERGLAALHNATLAGFSQRQPRLKAWRSQVPSKITRTLELNDSVDSKVKEALVFAKSQGQYSTQEYVKALVSLAQKTSVAIRTKPHDTPAVQNSDRSSWANEAFMMGATGTIGTAIGETALILATGRPSIIVAAGAFAGAVLSRAILKITEQ